MAEQQSEAVKEGLKQRDEALAKQRTQRDSLAESKPTPTQDENDRTALGEAIIDHEDDGSGPDPAAVTTRNMEAQKPSGSGYTTRQSGALSGSTRSPSSPRHEQPKHE